MANTNDSSILANYHLLVSRVDELCQNITHAFSAAINCRPGCSACCRHLTIFPVEAAALLEALQKLPEAAAKLLAELAQLPTAGPCPFLQEGLCLAYAARPIICRTHGLPILARTDGEALLDYCPENFRETTSLPGSGIINIDALNQALVAINAQFVKESADSRFREQERFSISDIIRMALQQPRCRIHG